MKVSDESFGQKLEHSHEYVDAAFQKTLRIARNEGRETEEEGRGGLYINSCHTSRPLFR
jgi:hypothetical protein